MQVALVDVPLDLIIFKISGASFRYASLPLYAGTPLHGEACVLVVVQLSFRKKLITDIDTTHSIGVHEGRVTNVNPRHLSYDCPSFSGDSGRGGAVVVKGGEVIGMHLETINQARERVRLLTPNTRLDDIEESVDSLIRGRLSSGFIALGSAEIRKCLAKVM